jgi:3-hydroxyisobutyrate dehydrogenase
LFLGAKARPYLEKRKSENMEKQIFGFIGIGNMGAPMAGRLIDAGHEVHVCDQNQAAVAKLVARGAHTAQSAQSLGNVADTVFVSLPTPQIVQSVLLQDGGLSSGSRVRQVVDFSTIGPRTAGLVAAGLAKRDIVYVDAPVSGGVSGAANGTLAVMVSCPSGTYDALADVLSCFGKIFHVGEGAGQAQTLKLANNLLSVAAIALTSEVMVMGVKAGLHPRMMLDVINAGSGRNSAAQDKFPRAILPGTFDFGFGTGLAYKDVRLCVDEAESLGVPMVVGAAVREMMAVTNAMYGADSDFTSLCRVVESWGGAEVRG